MALRLPFALILLGTAFLGACTNPPSAANLPKSTALTETPDRAPLGQELPSMCRMTDPREVLLEFAEVPAVRRGRVPSTLAASVTPDERAADPEFDGFRLGTVDHEWIYVEPARPMGEQRPVRFDVQPTPSGFVATIEPGRNGRLLDDSGTHNDDEFLPGPEAPIVYTFERHDACWQLASVNEVVEGADAATYGSVAAMCRETNPSSVLSTWARFPEVRRGRVPPSLQSTVPLSEKAAQPDFDGFRIALIDNEWAYAKPDIDVGEWPAIEPVTTANEEGFSVEFDAPNAGGRSRYRFARADDCWRMTGHEVMEQGERK